MSIATGGIASMVMVAACLCGMSGMAAAQAVGSNAGNGGLNAVPSSGNAARGGGAGGSTLNPTPGLTTPGGAVGSGLGSGAGNSMGNGTGLGTGTRLGTGITVSPGHVPNNMRANGTSLNQNPDPRVPGLSGRPAAPR
ncbi:hypothetical protein [Burkholderia sp. WSM2230]|uniref:hypothetical protein n=1 Tax=Burkholderia sp. WSM2230 TaxID=944435 RepID=UPI0004195C25|nr:hypothetical protein [Burkholderia sp. WSM2230]